MTSFGHVYSTVLPVPIGMNHVLVALLSICLSEQASTSVQTPIPITQAAVPVQFQNSCETPTTLDTTPTISAPFQSGYTVANEWRSFENWECNTPPATAAGYEIVSFRNVSMYGFKDTISGLLLFGGRRYPLARHTINETWIFNLKEQLWSKTLTTVHPPPRKRHSMVSWCEESIVLIGGSAPQSTETCTDVWIFNTRTSTWNEVTVHGRPPPTLHESTARTVVTIPSLCECNQTIVMLDTEGDWSKLWELRCIRDQLEYEWVQVRVRSSHNPMGGLGRLTTSAVRKGVIYALTKEGLWNYSHSFLQWSLHSGLQPPLGTQANYNADLVYLEDDDQLVVISRVSKHLYLYVHSLSNLDGHNEWYAAIMVGNFPVPLIRIRPNRYTTRNMNNAYVIALTRGIWQDGFKVSRCFRWIDHNCVWRSNICLSTTILDPNKYETDT